MGLLPYIAVGAGLLGGAVLLRKAKETAPAPSSGGGTDLCDRLPTEDLRNACKAVRAGLQIADAVLPDQRGTTNARLNGPIVQMIDLAAFVGSTKTGVRIPHPLTERGVRYQNGCVPIPGHPDHAKCAAGTISIVNGEWFNGQPTTHGRSTAGMSGAALLSGDPRRDALTFKWTAPSGFPLPGSGEPWIARGMPIRCPAGTTINSGVDHRTGAVAPICAPASSPVPPPPVVPTTTRPPIVTTTSDGSTRDRRDPER